MIQRSTLRYTAMFCLALATAVAMSAENAIVRVFADKHNNVHVVNGSGQESLVNLERYQVGIDAIKTAADKLTAGWLVLYRNPDAGSPVAGKLVLWRDGRIIRSFPAGQTFWSWSFVNNGDQVAFHLGPIHGETASHCELHDIRTGRHIASWDGDLQSADRPAWTKNLDH